MEHKKYKEFYDLAFKTVEILEPTPDLKAEIEKIPNLYKLLLVEYIKNKTYQIVSTAMGLIGDTNGVIFMNGASVALNKVNNLINESIKDEKAEHISLISRKKLEKKK